MKYQQWSNNFIHLMMVVFVAGMLPLSCIVHCYITSTPAEPSAIGLFVCHPFTTVDTESPQHLHAHTGTLRATHEVAMPIGLLLLSVIVTCTLVPQQRTYTGWHARPTTPPPRSF